MRDRRALVILAAVAVTGLGNVANPTWVTGPGVGSFRPADMRVSVIAGQAAEGYFPATVLNAVGFVGSLDSVRGLVPGRQDLSRQLLSHARRVTGGSPLDIRQPPQIPRDAITRTSQYRCKVLPMCTLTIGVPVDADESTVLTGYWLSGTDTYYLVPAEWTTP